MTDQDRKNTISNFIGSMKGISGEKCDEILQRQLGHFYKADAELAMKVPEGLSFKFIPENINQ